METLNGLINVMLILINVGIAFIIAKNILSMMFNIEEKESYIKKIKNSIIAFVVAISIFAIKAIIENYFK